MAHMHRRKIFLVIIFWICAGSGIYAQEFSPLLPDSGNLAVVQKKIDLHGGLVVLSIAIAPGFEDIPSLAYFRLNMGAEIGCVYITNGEDIPNYESGKGAYETAKQRKEESYQSMSLLHGEAFFLNVPAPLYLSVEHDTMDIDKYFLRLDKILSDMKPDVILINSDYIFLKRESKRRQVIERYVAEALSRLKKGNQWSDVKIFEQSNEINKGDIVHVDENNAPRKKSYRKIAADIKMQYRSLRAMIPVWENSYQPRYIPVYPKRSNQLRISEIHSPAIPQRLKELAVTINEIAESQEGQTSKNQFSRLHETISKIDFFINRGQKTLRLQEKKLLLFWKRALEEYRCALHHLFIPYTLRDEKVTALQIFYVKIGSLGPWIKKGKTSLIFPGVVERKWIVDTRQDYTYPLLADTAWLVLSPEVFPPTAPVNDVGYNALQMRNTFTFMVVHEEEQLINNYVYQKNIPLVAVPSQSLEILTPFVFANRDSMVVVKITNNLFNALKGELQAEDSIVSILPHRIFLPPKSTKIDSLRLQWKGSPLYGEHEFVLQSKKNNSIGKIICNRPIINTKAKRPVGIFSIIDQTPLKMALRRIEYPYIDLDTANVNCMDKISTIIIDDESSRIVHSHPEMTRKIKDWIWTGGTLVVFPQYGPPAIQIPDDSVGFSYNNSIVSMQEVHADTDQFPLQYPNTVEVSKWQSAGSVISYGEIHVKRNTPVAIPMISQTTKMPLLAVRRYGQGTIIYSALNLHPQLITIQTEAYKFLANILND